MAMLRQGLSGEPVRQLQRKLGIEADGKFGPTTQTALKAWQSEHGLASDGVAGPDTFVAMGLWELILLRPGTKGEAVRKLQEKLGLPADGSYGPATENAVRDYQKRNGLADDGIAGPVTLAHIKLFREMTPDVVQQSQVPASPVAPGEVQTAGMQGAAAEGKRSIWDTITGVFK